MTRKNIRRTLKVVSLCIIMAMLLSIGSVSALADTITTEEMAHSEILATLRFVEPVKAQFGLEDVDFEDIRIGFPIRTYICGEEDIEEWYSLYPLLADGELVAFATEVESEGEKRYEISTSLARDINAMDVYSGRVAIFYGSNGTYLLSNTTLHQVVDYEDEIEGRQEISSLESILPYADDVVLASTNVSMPLGYVSPEVASPNAYYSVSVGYVPQSGDTCWAATAASIINYWRGTSYTHSDVVIRYRGSYIDGGINRNEAQNVYALYNLTGYTYRNYVNHALLYNNLSMSSPVHGHFYSSSDAHAGVVSGYDTSSRQFVVMDPNSGFCTGAQSANTQYTYTNNSKGYTLILGYATTNIA